MIINIKYSLNFEKKRIKYTLKNIDFYKKHWYPFYINNNFEKEYNEKDFFEIKLLGKNKKIKSVTVGNKHIPDAVKKNNTFIIK